MGASRVCRRHVRCAESCTGSWSVCSHCPLARGPTMSLLPRDLGKSNASNMLDRAVPGLTGPFVVCRVPVETVISIYMQQAQLHVKKTNTTVKNAASQYASRFATLGTAVHSANVYLLTPSACRYQAGADMLELCAEADLSPCVFLRRLLEVEPWRCNKQVQQVTRPLDCMACNAVML